MRAILAMGFLMAALTLAHGETALEAMGHLPKGQAARVAIIEGRDGQPQPDRWYFVTQDPASDTGVHEYVVSGGVVVTSRAVSQFAYGLKAADIIAPDAIKVDSDKVAAVARDYAAANGADIAAESFELKRVNSTPEWRVICTDAREKRVGTIVVLAESGTVVSHDGFPREPGLAVQSPGATGSGGNGPRFETYAKSDVGPSPTPGGTDATGHRRKAPAAKKESVLAKTMQDVGRTLQKFNPF